MILVTLLDSCRNDHEPQHRVKIGLGPAEAEKGRLPVPAVVAVVPGHPGDQNQPHHALIYGVNNR